MKNFDDLLSDKIRSELTTYEAPYNPADWEQFRKRNDRNPLIWQWTKRTAGVAASVLLLCLAYHYFEGQHNNTTAAVVPQPKNVEPSQTKQDKENNAVGINEKTFADDTYQKSIVKNGNNSKNNTSIVMAARPHKAPRTNKQAVHQTQMVEPNQTPIAEATLTTQHTFIDFIRYDKNINFPLSIDKPTFMMPPAEVAEVSKKSKIAFKLALVAALNAQRIEGAPTFASLERGVLVDIALMPSVWLQSGVSVFRYDITKTLEVDTQSQRLATIMPVDEEPDFVNFSASLIHIPVNIRFDVLRKSSIDLFASAGTSNYLYLSEQTAYSEPDGGWFSEPYPAFSSKALAASANGSLGAEYRFARHFSAQTEFFTRLPLRNMGNENLRLSSSGVMFKLVYRN